MSLIRLLLTTFFLVTSVAAAAADQRLQVSNRLTEIAGEGLNPDVTLGRSFSLPPRQ